MKSEWRTVALGSVADLTVGFVGTMASNYTETGIPFLRSTNIEPFDIKLDDIKYISSNFNESLRKSELHPNDVVIVRTGTPGACAVIPAGVKAWNCSDLVIVRPHRNKLNPLFLASYVNLASGVINTQLVGAVQQHYNVGAAKKMQIPLPPIGEQDKIASIIGMLNKKITINSKINDNLFAQMQALYAAWFIDCIPFGGIKPLSWQKTSIYTIADIIYGAPFSSKQFNTDGKGIPIIRIRDLKEQKVATYTTEKHPKGYLLQAGDIVVGMDGEFVPYIWGSDEAWLNQRVCVFKNKRLKGKAFLYFTIKPLLYAIEQTQVATTVIHIGKKDFDAFEITLPDPRVLDSFDAITTPMVEKIVENRFEIKQLELLRDALLPKLMSGELDVSNIQL